MNRGVLGALLPLEPPPLPSHGPWLAIAVVLLLLLLLSTALLRWRHPAQRRRRQLHRMQRRLGQADCDTRVIASELDQLLRATLAQPRLCAHAPPADWALPDWRRLLDTLAMARFASEPAPATGLLAVFPLAQRLVCPRHGPA